MAYAGICGGEDLQPHSDDYFHASSLTRSSPSWGAAAAACAASHRDRQHPADVDAGPDFTIPAARRSR